jgi:hypothetical protein
VQKSGTLGFLRQASPKAGEYGLEPVLKMERGCVEDQPQRRGEHNQPGFHGVLRLVEDDTAALHS